MILEKGPRSTDVGAKGTKGKSEMGIRISFTTYTTNHHPTDLLLARGEKVKSFSSPLADSVTCAILDDGSVKCWGNNAIGQLGLGDTIPSNRGGTTDTIGDNLQALDFGTDLNAEYLYGGVRHHCVVFSNGAVKCWGYNSAGQLGIGDKINRGASHGDMGASLPWLDLGADRDAEKLALGMDHTCALLDDGCVKCWGAGDSGQLGYGDYVDELSPPSDCVDLGSLYKDICSGNKHVCAIRTDGSVRCWGSNYNAELGIGYGYQGGASKPTPQVVQLGS